MTYSIPNQRPDRETAAGGRGRWLRQLLLICCGLCLGPAAWGNGGFLKIRDGYFWDPVTADYFIPRGFGYQTWNPPVGADQTFSQLDYDLVEFKKMHVNSIRCEMVWNVVETNQGVFDWSKPDHLVAKAEELGFKLFVLIGFQYAPSWFPTNWLAVNDQGTNSVVLSYENPDARAACSNYIYQVTSRYKNSPVIGAWILGNEYAYFDLWNPDRQFLGFDSYSQASFRAYLASTYAGNIAALNTNWGTSYANFTSVVMPRTFPPDHHNPAYHDLIQWRKQSIGDYVAAGAVGAKLADPNHLHTYSMVGGVFSGVDALYTCEDAKTIVARCAHAGAPLDFWSVNNYAGATVGDEMRSADFGIRKYQAQSGLPVMVSETGHSSTENLPLTAGPRAAKGIPTQMWEALSSGAIGMHVFTWNDRDLFGHTTFTREKGFGIVNQNRLVKDPVYNNVVEVFRRMENIQANHLFGGSSNAPKDIQFFWSTATDMGWSRANKENAMLWGALKRLGYQPGFIDDAQFENGDYLNAPALMLSRCFKLNPAHLERIANNVIPAGIHVHANADLPGQFDAYDRRNTNWISRMSSLFGLNAGGTPATCPVNSGVTAELYSNFSLTAVASLGAFTPGYVEPMVSWQVWQGLSASSGTTIVTHKGCDDLQASMPALQIKNLGTAKTAINTFALGDIGTTGSQTNSWNIHSYWLRTIYQTYFGITPKIGLGGTGPVFVIADYRICRNGGILISLMNEDTNATFVTVTAPTLLAGKTVENLTTGGVLTTNSSGAVGVFIEGDEFVLLYAYNSSAGVDASLVNSNPNKVWLQDAPGAVWPNGPGYPVTVGYDTAATNLNLILSFERTLFPGKTYSQSIPAAASGRGTRLITLAIPDADLNDPDYISSRAGGEYIVRARLEKAGVSISESFLPVRLLWGLRPTSLPIPVLPNNTYPITLQWEELPSYEVSETPTPLSRAGLWEPVRAKFQNYDVVLELRTNGVPVVSNHFLTSTGTTSHQFSVTVPPNVTGPFTWFAYLRPAAGASFDVIDSFEDRNPGDLYKVITNCNANPDWCHDSNGPPLFPWISYTYPTNGNQQWFTEGVGTNASDGNFSAFLVVTNPPWIPEAQYSGLGIKYTYATDWALPNDSRLWTNYTFSCDFMEASNRACVVELQLNDVYTGQIHFATSYLGHGWQTIKASLDQFTINPNLPYPPGFFVRGKVHQLAINVQMLETNATYITTFDNIKFDGPEMAAPAVTSHDVLDSFEDREPGLDPVPGPSLLMPWAPYVYADFGNAGDGGHGIQTFGSDGGQSAFEVVQNPANPGTFSGFGMSYLFTNQWALLGSRTQWTNYLFSFDFKEANAHRCILEMQVKSGQNDWMGFTNTYVAGPNGWFTIKASLDKFKTNGAFVASHIQALAVNIQMLDKNVTYLGSFDNIRFDGPDTPLPPDLTYALYDSGNDSLRDADGDGIPDVYETGTGIYVSPTNTGTNPNKADTDGDGLSDRFELIAGTDPNKASDLFRIKSVRRNLDGSAVISWQAKTNKVYGIDYIDGSLFDGAQFCPLEGMTNLRAVTNGLFEAQDAGAATNRFRLYRITVRNP